MIAAIIVACEIGFWVFVLAGLFFRYVLRKKAIGALFLVCTPLIDLLLLAVTALDLKNGATADFFHGLAAVYIGISIAFGHRMIRWADERFAHRFAGGPAPSSKPKYGWERARYERRMWYRHLLAWLIGSAILYGMILYVDDAERTKQLYLMIVRWLIVLGIDFAISFSYTIWPKKEDRAST